MGTRPVICLTAPITTQVVPNVGRVPFPVHGSCSPTVPIPIITPSRLVRTPASGLCFSSSCCCLPPPVNDPVSPLNLELHSIHLHLLHKTRLGKDFMETTCKAQDGKEKQTHTLDIQNTSSLCDLNDTINQGKAQSRSRESMFANHVSDRFSISTIRRDPRNSTTTEKQIQCDV